MSIYDNNRQYAEGIVDEWQDVVESELETQGDTVWIPCRKRLVDMIANALDQVAPHFKEKE